MVMAAFRIVYGTGGRHRGIARGVAPARFTLLTPRGQVWAVRRRGPASARARRTNPASMSVPTRLCPSRVSGFGLLPTGPFYPRSQGQTGGLATGFITPSTLDVAFREDESQLRKGRASRNPCLLRRMALNLLRPDTAVKTGAAIRHRKTGRNLAGMGARPGPGTILRLPWRSPRTVSFSLLRTFTHCRQSGSLCSTLFVADCFGRYSA